MEGLQLELYDNGSASQIAEMCRNIMEPIFGMPIPPPLDGYPQSVSPFGILYPPLSHRGW